MAGRVQGVDVIRDSRGSHAKSALNMSSDFDPVAGKLVYVGSDSSRFE